MSDENKFVITKIAEVPENHRLNLEILETDHITGVYTVELDITWCKYKEQVATLQKRITDLESENKALRLIADSHSMSELRRNRIMAGWRRGDTLKNEVKHESKYY